MFINTLSKIIFINKSSEPKIKICKFLSYSYLEDYKKLKKSYPTIEFLYKDLLKQSRIYNKFNNYHIFIFDNDDFINALIDYCVLLQLDKTALDKIIEYSNVCEMYEENHQYFISVYDEDFILDTSKIVLNKSKIHIKDLSMFPAEFFVNCMDNNIAIQKYSRMRLFDLYITIKDLQYLLIKENKSIPKELQCFGNSDQTTLLLENNDIFNNVIKTLNEYNVDTNKFTCPINKYLDLNPNFGYDRYFMTKYNYMLAKYLKSIDYRITQYVAKRL